MTDGCVVTKFFGFEVPEMHSLPFVAIEGRSYAPSHLPFDRAERDDLIAARVLVSSGSMYKFIIVGAAVIGGSTIFVLPKYISSDEATPKLGALYIRILKRYLMSGSKRDSVAPTLDNIPLVMRTFEELNRYYLKGGIYKERQNVHISSSDKRINWSKTILRNQAVFSSIESPVPLHSVLYTNPIVNSHNSYEGEISRLFRVILSSLATFIAPILQLNHPLEIRVGVDQVVDDLSGIIGRSPYYKRILRAHIAAEAGTRKRVLKILYNFLSSDGEGIARIFGERVFVFGTRDFENVWEDACISSTGAQRANEVLAQPVVSPASGLTVSNQRADGILLPNTDSDPAVIVDAKYYVSDEGEQISLPVGDVMKQYGYAISARASWPRKKIRNAFLLPDKAKEPQQAGRIATISMALDGVNLPDVDPIMVIKVAPQAIFEAYLSRVVDQRIKAALIAPEIQDSRKTQPAAMGQSERVVSATLDACEITVSGLPRSPVIDVGSSVPRINSGILFKIAKQNPEAGFIASIIVDSGESKEPIGYVQSGKKFIFLKSVALPVPGWRETVKSLLLQGKRGTVRFNGDVSLEELDADQLLPKMPDSLRTTISLPRRLDSPGSSGGKPQKTRRDVLQEKKLNSAETDVCQLRMIRAIERSENRNFTRLGKRSPIHLDSNGRRVVVAHASKRYDWGEYWYTFYLSSADDYHRRGYSVAFAFGMNDQNVYLLVPYEDIQKLKPSLTPAKENGCHIHLRPTDKGLFFLKGQRARSTLASAEGYVKTLDPHRAA